MTKLLITILLGLSSFIASGQIASDTLFFNNIEIRVYTYKIESDTIRIAYFDREAIKYTKKGQSSFNEMIYRDRRNSLIKHIRSLYPDARVKSTDLQKVGLTPFDKEQKPDSSSAITKDYYWIGAINHYTQKIENSPNDHLNYFELARAYIEYEYGSSFFNSDRIITLLDSSILLNREFEKAYLLKSKSHEEIGIWKGIMMSDPHVDVVDLEEIELAVNCLNELLILKPQCKEAEDYRNELVKKYGL